MEGSEENNTAGLQRRQSTTADYFEATKEQLIAAGICEPAWFPVQLVPEVCRDGRPKIGNNGRQRYKRTYVIDGREPETILTHRPCQDGERWLVQIAIGAAEQRRREEAEAEEWKQRNAKYEAGKREREKQDALAREAAEPIVRQLRARYPGLAHIEGEIRTLDWKLDRTLRQELTFYARSVEVLIRYGLVTEEMLSTPDKGGWRSGDLREGGSFFLQQATDRRGEYWYVRLWTCESPRERKNFPVSDARRVLSDIMTRANQ